MGRTIAQSTIRAAAGHHKTTASDAPHQAHAGAAAHMDASHSRAGHGHAGHDHGAMIADFRLRFWISAVLTIPVLALSPMIQGFLGLQGALAFRGADYVLFALSAAIF